MTCYLSSGTLNSTNSTPVSSKLAAIANSCIHSYPCILTMLLWLMICMSSLCCISPVLAANVIKGCEVTIGSDQGTATAIEQMGSKHINKNVTVSLPPVCVCVCVLVCMHVGVFAFVNVSLQHRK